MGKPDEEKKFQLIYIYKLLAKKYDAYVMTRFII